MNIEFKWIGGATWILTYQNIKIACDPVLCPAGTIHNYKIFKGRRLIDPVFSAADFQDIDMWLITHAHEDHLDPEGLSHIQNESRIITHKNARHRFRSQKHVKTLNWGEKISDTINGIDIMIEAIPAVHGVKPLIAFLAGGVNGYWITFSDKTESLSVYVTSDTVLHKKVVCALKKRSVDLLIPNMGAAQKGRWMGTLTLSAAMLESMLELINPTLCIPVHFGTFDHYVEPISEVEKWAKKNIVILKPGEVYKGKLR